MTATIKPSYAELASRVSELEEELGELGELPFEEDWRLEAYETLVELVRDVERGVRDFAELVAEVGTR